MEAPVAIVVIALSPESILTTSVGGVCPVGNVVVIRTTIRVNYNCLVLLISGIKLQLLSYIRIEQV